jgi:membrane protease YdiL (CAAX protease family)
LTIANNALSSLLPNTVTDPIPIFFISIIFGMLYIQTNRMVAPIAAHVTFNTISFCLTMVM